MVPLVLALLLATPGPQTLRTGTSPTDAPLLLAMRVVGGSIASGVRVTTVAVYADGTLVGPSPDPATRNFRFAATRLDPAALQELRSALDQLPPMANGRQYSTAFYGDHCPAAKRMKESEYGAIQPAVTFYYPREGELRSFGFVGPPSGNDGQTASVVLVSSNCYRDLMPRAALALFRTAVRIVQGTIGRQGESGEVAPAEGRLVLKPFAEAKATLPWPSSLPRLGRPMESLDGTVTFSLPGDRLAEVEAFTRQSRGRLATAALLVKGGKWRTVSLQALLPKEASWLAMPVVPSQEPALNERVLSPAAPAAQRLTPRGVAREPLRLASGAPASHGRLLLMLMEIAHARDAGLALLYEDGTAIWHPQDPAATNLSYSQRQRLVAAALTAQELSTVHQLVDRLHDTDVGPRRFYRYVGSCHEPTDQPSTLFLYRKGRRLKKFRVYGALSEAPRAPSPADQGPGCALIPEEVRQIVAFARHLPLSRASAWYPATAELLFEPHDEMASAVPWPSNWPDLSHSRPVAFYRQDVRQLRVDGRDLPHLYGFVDPLWDQHRLAGLAGHKWSIAVFPRFPGQDEWDPPGP